jgi:hypothetical protein
MRPQRLRQFDRWTRPCFCLRHPKGSSRPPARPTPPRVTWASFSPFFVAPDRLVSRQTNPLSVPQPADGAMVLEPIWERPAGPKTHSRRPGKRLGQTRRARQGLVRVPESNTKYGGNCGKTGGAERRCCRQVSVSPQGFPRQKICSDMWKPASPRCSQGRYFFDVRDCTGETHVRLRSAPR